MMMVVVVVVKITTTTTTTTTRPWSTPYIKEPLGSVRKRDTF
jgi:hypothetical protein